MSITHAEAVASVHVMVAVARADGKLHEEERRAIEGALGGVELSGIVDATELFDEDFSLDEQLALLTTPEAREETFRSAFSLAHADGECSKEENELLEEVRVKLGVSVERREELAKIFGKLGDEQTETKSFFQFVEDPLARKTTIARETRKCAIVSAVLGAFPFPGLALITDLAVIALQVGLVRDIAALHGQALDKKAAKSLLTGVGVTGARLALSNLAKLLPGWGSVVGATTSFASTYAVGRVFEDYFARAADAPPIEKDALREKFKAAESEGKREYEANRKEIETKQQASKAEVERLAREVKEGKLSDDELVSRMSHLP